MVAITLIGTVKWLNFFDPDDVLGYPLKPLSPKHQRAVGRDAAINAGGIAAGGNPMSHSRYRSDNAFTESAAKFLEGLI